MKRITKEQFKKEWNPNLFALIGMDEREFFDAVDEFEFTIAQAERERCAKAESNKYVAHKCKDKIIPYISMLCSMNRKHQFETEEEFKKEHYTTRDLTNLINYPGSAKQ